MDLRVLGPVQAAVDDHPVAIGAGKPRALLAMLALNEGTPVSSEVLIDGLWGEAPPATAPKMVQVYVSQLRKVLGGSDNGAEILTRGRGYELRLGEGELDVRRFERPLVGARPLGRRGRRSARRWRIRFTARFPAILCSCRSWAGPIGLVWRSRGASVLPTTSTPADSRRGPGGARRSIGIDFVGLHRDTAYEWKSTTISRPAAGLQTQGFAGEDAASGGLSSDGGTAAVLRRPRGCSTCRSYCRPRWSRCARGSRRG
jgi:hypothetical protein